MIHISFSQLFLEKGGDGVCDALKVLVALLLGRLETACHMPLDERHRHRVRTRAMFPSLRRLSSMLGFYGLWKFWDLLTKTCQYIEARQKRGLRIPFVIASVTRLNMSFMPSLACDATDRVVVRDELAMVVCKHRRTAWSIILRDNECEAAKVKAIVTLVW